MCEQARTLLHVSNLFGTTIASEVATTLDRLIGGPSGQTFFCNSGAEANECAIKTRTREWAGPGRYSVVSAYGSFHGRTLATLHTTGQPAEARAVPTPARGLPPRGLERPRRARCESRRLGRGRGAARARAGRGGRQHHDTRVPAGGRRLCDDRGILLILDEVQTGLGRTGKWFGFQHVGVEPDVVTMAKALGNGVPIGACSARDDVAAAFVPGDHATTFGGQPLASAAARAVLEVMQREDVPARATAAGARLTKGLESIAAIARVRGLGLLIAAELRDRPSREVVAAALDAGLVINAVTDSAVRFAPSLLVTDDEIDEGVDILTAVLT